MALLRAAVNAVGIGAESEASGPMEKSAAAVSSLLADIGGWEACGGAVIGRLARGTLGAHAGMHCMPDGMQGRPTERAAHARSIAHTAVSRNPAVG